MNDKLGILELNQSSGSFHPITTTLKEISLLLQDLGFTQASGPEIESEKFNFDMLNIKESHPARQMHDTFYVNNKSGVLRTHTSPVQIRAMLENKPPFAFFSGGKVYRKDDDSTHLPMFHQIAELPFMRPFIKNISLCFYYSILFNC